MLLIENVTGGDGGGVGHDHGISDKDDGGDGNPHTQSALRWQSIVVVNQVKCHKHTTMLSIL